MLSSAKDTDANANKMAQNTVNNYKFKNYNQFGQGYFNNCIIKLINIFSN